MATVQSNSNCTSCKLHETAQAVCLMGRGPVPCKVMLIGEAPGLREDDIGKPFQGKAGKLLDRVLNELSIDREKVYITNVVKCRPPDNRTPRAGEMKACRQHLVREFKELVPQYVLLLGAAAFKGVLKQTGITNKRGSIYEEGGITYMPTFHPAKILREPSLYPLLLQDFQTFFDRIGGKIRKAKTMNLEVIESIDHFKGFVERDFEPAKKFSYDSETTGLDPRATNSAIRCLGIGLPEKSIILPMENPESPFFGDLELQKSMLEILTEIAEGKKVVAQNGKFDNGWIRFLYGNLRFPLTFDTMLASYLLDENSPNGLKYMVKTILGQPDYDVDLKIKIGGGSIPKLYEYCGRDVMYTLELYEKFKRQLMKDPVLKNLFLQVLMPAVRVFERVEYNGIFVDLKRMKEVGKQLIDQILAIDQELAKFKTGINWGSTQQLGKYLFEEEGLDPFEFTGTGMASTKESVLKRLKSQHEVPSLILKRRECAKALSTYVGGEVPQTGKKRKSKAKKEKGWPPYIKGDRMYLSFKLHGTVTGRLSSRLHQTPRDPLIRSIISAPPGWTFVCADYSQIELRIAAILSGDREMMMAYQTGQDLHRKTAIAMVGHEEITKELRKKAKAVNFGFLFGMGAKKFQQTAWEKYELELSIGECKQFRRRFFEVYSGLPAWHDRQRRIVHSSGEVRNLIGRIRHLPEIYSPDQGRMAEAERQAINAPVQGFASDLKLMAIIEISECIPQDKLILTGEVHDAILMQIWTPELKPVLLEVKEIMEHPRILRELGVELTLPLVADLEVGAWGSGENFLIDK